MASTISAGLTTTTALVYTADTSGVLQLQTNGTTTAVTIDTAQNMGLGVTPNTWTNTVVMQMGANATYGGAWYGASTTTGGIYLGSNNYYNSGFKYQTANLATYYSQNDSGSGAHKWWISSGTPSVNGAVTFTQAMTLDNSGNLLVAGSSTPGSFATGSIVVGAGANTSSSYNKQLFYSQNYSNAAGMPHFVGNANINLWGIGTYNATGTTQVRIGGVATNSSGFTWSGYSDVFAGAYTNASDYRIKENVQNYPDTGLSQVLALRPVTFKLKDITYTKGDETLTPVGKNDIGFIAHEVQAVIPLVVTGEKDAVNPDGTELHQGVDYSKLTTVLVKAIQELSAQVTALQAKVGV